MNAPIGELDLETIKANARKVLGRCEVCSLRDATLEGTLFEPKPSLEGVVSCINTRNYVDINDVEAGIARAKEVGGWPLGRLPEGGEFLVLVENKQSLGHR